MNATTVAVDLAKNVFELAAADAQWKVIERARLTRCEICPRLKPAGCSSSARRIAAARAMTWTWLLSCGFV